MRQLFLTAPGTLEWRVLAEPTPDGAGDALVRPVAVGSCDLDGARVRGLAPFDGPFALGHEFVAEIVEVAPDVAGLLRGQLVVVSFQIACGRCDNCARGRTGDCTAVPALSMFGFGELGGRWGGAVSDLVRVPFAEAMLVPLPHEVEPDRAVCVADGLADAWRTVAPYLRSSPDDAPVLIVGGAGPGSIGLYAAAVALALGASRVDYVDSDTRRLEIARSLGAQPVEGWPEWLERYPITVDASADPRGLSLALRSAVAGGVCTSTGIYYSAETPIPLLDMYMSGVTLVTGRCHARPVIPDLLTLMADGSLDPRQVTSERATWADAAEAFRDYTTKLILTRQ